ncbi:MAG TPA: flagellar basal body rod C-terminal domain-containing protein [Candidatus Eremiobacteraceae bacterium]|nr:flagellar basal body rod C-terminal domain-containing protein [Candidatus Eremiobacteraceae bacterium]
MEAPDSLACAAAGMRFQQARLDAIAANLANSNTPGFGALDTSGEFSARLTAARNTQGSLRPTGVATDLALTGPGYFAVAAPEGVRYTRDGRLSASGDTLRDIGGHALLGSLGAVRFPRGASVDTDGRIVASGRVIDRLRVVDLGQSATRDASGYFSASSSAAIRRSAAQIRSGFLEDSGVNPLLEMTALVSAQRAFEADQKTAQRADETLRRAVTDVPAVHA